MAKPNVNIFIDTNIYLSFYGRSTDDLNVLKELKSKLSNNTFGLIVTEQVKDEFYRQRENNISEALKKLDEINFNLEIPGICKTDSEKYTSLIDAKKTYAKVLYEMRNTLEDLAITNSLEADNIIKSIFEYSTNIERKKDIFELAYTRIKVGNPPGKKNNICDAINWELILKESKKGVDLVIISTDGDYGDVLDKKRVKPFLQNEWKKKKKSEITLFNNLNDFLNKHLPELILKGEQHDCIDNLVKALENSQNFSQTHIHIKELQRYFDKLDVSQVARVINALETNTQISWILTDDDVREFIKNILEAYPNVISEQKKEAIRSQMVGPPSDQT